MHSPLLPNVVLLTIPSKTFLARLCEQAERYDGTSSASIAHGNDSLTNLLIRNGYLYEGKYPFIIMVRILLTDGITGSRKGTLPDVARHHVKR